MPAVTVTVTVVATAMAAGKPKPPRRVASGSDYQGHSLLSTTPSWLRSYCDQTPELQYSLELR